MPRNPLHQFSSLAQSCLTLCDPMNRSTPGLPVHHQLPEFTQTHVHWLSNAIQPSHPLSSGFNSFRNSFRKRLLLILQRFFKIFPTYLFFWVLEYGPTCSETLQSHFLKSGVWKSRFLCRLRGKHKIWKKVITSQFRHPAVSLFSSSDNYFWSTNSE